MSKFTTMEFQTLKAEEAPFKPEALTKVFNQQSEDFAEELTPEGIQLVITGAERITEPTETDMQGKLW